MELNSYKIDKDKLIKYGFIYKDKYVFKKNINDSLYAEFIIDEGYINIEVYERETNEEYLPFHINDITGSYVSKVREEVDEILNDILDKCFKKNEFKDELLEYVKDKYSTTPEYPWSENSYCTLKVNNKWYALFMDIPYKSLGIDKDGKIDVVNLKNDSEKITNLIDNKNYFKAYHMNKKYWITILLDNNIDINDIKKLIDESYEKVK